METSIAVPAGFASFYVTSFYIDGKEIKHHYHKITVTFTIAVEIPVFLPMVPGLLMLHLHIVQRQRQGNGIVANCFHKQSFIHICTFYTPFTSYHIVKVVIMHVCKVIFRTIFFPTISAHV